MRRVITVNLGGNAFQLDEDAYERLRAYLTLTESRLGRDPDRNEIVADIERAVADHIVAARTEASGIVVSDAEMAQALTRVGNVEFTEAQRTSTTATGPLPASSWRDETQSEYTRLPVFLLCFLFGWLGIHRFFVGKIGTGVLMLVTIGGVGIWVVIDLILIICGAFKDREGRKILRWS